MIPTTEPAARPERRIACLVVGRDEDALAIGEALRWRSALGARLSVLYVLPAPSCIVSSQGGVWSDDPIAVREAAEDWLAAHTAGLAVDERILLPGHVGASAGDWIGRVQPLLVVAARRRGRLGRLLDADAAAHLPRHPRCAVRVVSRPAASELPRTRGRPTRQPSASRPMRPLPPWREEARRLTSS